MEKRPVGRPKKKPEERRKYQRIAILKDTYEKATYNAAIKDQPLIEYFDKIVREDV